MTREKFRLTPTGFAFGVLSAIADPKGTTDQGITAKRRAIELMEAAGLTTADATQMLQEWLDAPQPGDQIADSDSPLVKAMAVGAFDLLASNKA